MWKNDLFEEAHDKQIATEANFVLLESQAKTQYGKHIFEAHFRSPRQPGYEHVGAIFSWRFQELEFSRLNFLEIVHVNVRNIFGHPKH
jgi:hypothetical protein